MRIVVTGGAGFIGSHLSEALSIRGDAVVCLERPGASRRFVRDLPVDFRDIGVGNVDALRQVFDGADVVFHLAGVTEAASPQDYYRVNTEGTANVLRAAAALGGAAPRVVLASSLAAIGPCRNGEPLSPDSTPAPLSHYGHSKLLAEALVHAYRDRVPAVILRLSSVYGPREKAVLTFFRMIHRGFALGIGSWEREVSLLYVRDAVSGLLSAGEAAFAVGRIYCLSHPEHLSWRRVAQAIGEAVGRAPRLLTVPPLLAEAVGLVAEGWASLRRRAAILNRDRIRELRQRRWVCDVSRAIGELGFRPAYALARGAAETAHWYREEQWL